MSIIYYYDNSNEPTITQYHAKVPGDHRWSGMVVSSQMTFEFNNLISMQE